MPYKSGRPVIDLSLLFKIASALVSYIIIPVAFLVNYMMFFTKYKNRFRLKGIQRAITVSNHTTFLDPAKIAFLVFPRLLFHTLLEATVESPYLGTFTRVLGGVPIPRGITGYKNILKICRRAFNSRRYMHFYPEGECYLYNQNIKDFKPGAFFIASELNIPVIPLVTVFSKRPSFLSRFLPVETLIVMEPEYPSNYIRRNDKGEIESDSIREFSQIVRKKMQSEIEKHGGCYTFFKGHMKRIKGING